ncbi:MAG: hypothetical protein KGL68_17325, partial [Burkholderiales bacterium]|nr:hypothetical protein [Burkholderiales bacterium]
FDQARASRGLHAISHTAISNPTPGSSRFPVARQLLSTLARIHSGHQCAEAGIQSVEAALG